MKLYVNPSGIAGQISVPGSKSHTIRALTAALAAEGESRIIAPLESADTLAVRRACGLLGMSFRQEGRDWLCTGTGGRFTDGKDLKLDLGNSGTGLRFLSAMAAIGRGRVDLDGDESLRTRGMTGLLRALENLGASVSGKDGHCPVSVRGPLQGGETEVDGTTSQFISSLLFAAPLAEKDCTFDLENLNEKPYVALTLQWLKRLKIQYDASENLLHYHVPAGQKYRAFQAVIPADFSTALFPLAAAMIAGNGVEIRHLDFDDVQGDKACFAFFESMGAEWDAETCVVGKSGKLRGGVFDLNSTPDALPVMAAAAAVIPGETRLVHVPQARLKETDRIACMTRELRKMGADCTELADGMVIRGGRLRGGEVDGCGDHRIVMALAVAALAAEGETVIHGAEAAQVTYPDFIKDFQAMGAKYQPKE